MARRRRAGRGRRRLPRAGRQLVPRIGFDILLIVFAAVILGGIGSVYGAMLGGLVIGMVHELVPLFYQWGIIPVRSRYAAAVAFVIMVAILLVAPRHRG